MSDAIGSPVYTAVANGLDEATVTLLALSRGCCALGDAVRYQQVTHVGTERVPWLACCAGSGC